MNTEAINLMSALLGSKRVAECAVAYLARCREMPTEEEVAEAIAVPKATARKVVAAAKMSSTYLLDTLPVSLANPGLVAAFLCDLKDAPVEHLVVLTAGSDNTLIKRHECSTGSANSASVDPATVLRYAIEDRARAIIIVHNHPSGSLRFSKSDYDFTQQIIDGAKLLNLRVLDSILITHRGVNSMRVESQVMFEGQPFVR